MGHHLKKKKKRHSRAWIILGLLCLASFLLGYWVSVNGLLAW